MYTVSDRLCRVQSQGILFCGSRGEGHEGARCNSCPELGTCFA